MHQKKSPASGTIGRGKPLLIWRDGAMDGSGEKPHLKIIAERCEQRRQTRINYLYPSATIAIKKRKKARAAKTPAFGRPKPSRINDKILQLPYCGLRFALGSPSPARRLHQQ
tara:strand:- start:172 stop:507 length:336 start_codon:yes stop_codon:yes gene_type:complete